MNNKIFNIAAVLPVLVLFLAGCKGGFGDIDEPPVVSLINLTQGSAGYEGNGMVLGLRSARYVVKHELKEAVQEKDPKGRVRIFPKEDWYTVDQDGRIAKISSSTGGIPSIIGSEVLSNGTSGTSRDHYIIGLTNGEKYTVYFYGEPTDGDLITRLNPSPAAGAPAVASYTSNVFANLKNMNPGDKILVADRTTNESGASGYQTFSQVFNKNNHMVVLVNTPLHFTEFPRTFGAVTGSDVRIRGYDYDIVITSGDRDTPAPQAPYYMAANYGLLTVSAIEKDGQQYFILTGGTAWRGKIEIDWPK